MKTNTDIIKEISISTICIIISALIGYTCGYLYNR